MHWLSWELLCEPNFMYICIKSSIGTQGGWLAVKVLQPPPPSLPPPPPPPDGFLYWLFCGGPGVSQTLCCFVFILRGILFYVFSCVILFLCFSVLLALRLPRFGKRELILVLFVHLFDLRLFGFVGFLFLLVSGKGCGLWLWHFLDFSLTLCWWMYKNDRLQLSKKE